MDGHNETPSEIMAALVENTTSLDDIVRSLVEPIRFEREAIRAYFEQKGAISRIEDGTPTHPVGASDGAYLTSQTVVGDMLATLAISLCRGLDGAVEVTGHRHWTDFRAHSPENEVLVKAVMMAHEQALLTTLPNEAIKIIDGSHVTPLIALNIALASADDAVREHVIDLCRTEGIADAIGAIAGDDQVIACPKSDSSLDLWSECNDHLVLHGSPLPDKALATLVLEPGEVLSSKRTPPASWKYLHATQGRVTDSRARLIADRINDAIRPLRGEEEIAVHHAKPEGGVSVIRMELHPDLDFASPDMIASVCATVHTPFIQEPLAQYLADIFAKNLAVLSDVQMARTRLALSEGGDPAYLEYLTNYRTN